MTFWHEFVAALRRDDPRQIVIFMPDEMLTTLRAAASRRSVSVVEYVRQATAEMLRQDDAG